MHSSVDRYSIFVQFWAVNNCLDLFQRRLLGSRWFFVVFRVKNLPR